MNEFQNYDDLENYFSDTFVKLGVKDYDFCYIYSDLRFFASSMRINIEKDRFCNSIIAFSMSLDVIVI